MSKLSKTKCEEVDFTPITFVYITEMLKTNNLRKTLLGA